MKIAIGADGSGFELKEAIRKHLEELNIEYVDYAKEAREYYDIVPEVPPAVQSGECDYAFSAVVPVWEWHRWQTVIKESVPL
mgnify:CR=1 FL=1